MKNFRRYKDWDEKAEYDTLILTIRILFIIIIIVISSWLKHTFIKPSTFSPLYLAANFK